MLISEKEVNDILDLFSDINESIIDIEDINNENFMDGLKNTHGIYDEIQILKGYVMKLKRFILQ